MTAKFSSNYSRAVMKGTLIRKGAFLFFLRFAQHSSPKLHVLFIMFCLSCSVYRVLFIVFCLSCSVYHVLFIVFCLSYSVYHVLFIKFCLSFSVYHVLFIMFCLSYSVYRVLFIMFCLLCSWKCFIDTRLQSHKKKIKTHI